MFIISKRKIFYTLSSILVIISIVSIFTFGLKFGIDFTGGSILEFNYIEERPAKSAVEEKIKGSNIGEFSIRETGDKGFILKSGEINDDKKDEIEAAVSFNGESAIEVKRFNSIGPTLGDELQGRAVVALAVVIVAIIFFIAFTFRHVSKPVSSWKYGFVAVIALIHDIIITLGFFALLGGFYGVEIDTLFVVALLVILGYSINDTIVVLDRVRENLRSKKDSVRMRDFDLIVSKSLKETFARSINTSITTLLALVALYVFGGSSTQNFTLALIVGIVSGAYSSLFLAAPILVSFKNKQDKKQ